MEIHFPSHSEKESSYFPWVGGAEWSLQYRLQLISPHFHPILAFQILIGSLANDSVNEKKEKGAENVLVTFVELVNCGDHR